MRRSVNKIILLLLPIILIACGEDRTYEFLELTKENHWILSQMRERYYWGDNIKEPSRNAFFQTENKFFASLLNASDKASYYDDNAPVTSYGMSFAIMRDPLGIKASNYYALVLAVEPNSVAEKAGILRGSWITKVGNNNVSSSSYSVLQSGDSVTLCTANIEYNDLTEEYEWYIGDTLKMEPSTTVTPQPIALDSIYEERGKSIGYIVCNSIEGDTFIDEMRSSLLKMQNVDNIIIDLRYTTNGNIEYANAVANLLLTQESNGKAFCYLKGNNGNIIENGEFVISGEELIPNIDKIYLLVGAGTSCAAEAFVAAMKNNSNKVVIVGENSAGINFYTEAIESPYGFTIHPVVAEIYSGDDTILPSEGITPHYFVNELEQFQKIYPIGDRQEYMLYSTMHLITSGGLPRDNVAATKNLLKQQHIFR